MSRLTACLAFATLSLIVAGAAEAALLAYDGFNYAPAGSSLQGQGVVPGSGFSTPWVPGGFNASNHTNYKAASVSLTYPGLVTSGNRMSTESLGAIGGLVRSFPQPFGTTNQTVYFSFLMQPTGTLHGGAFNGFCGLYLNAATGNDIYAGKPGGGSIGSYVIENRGGSGQVASNVATEIGKTALLVVKAELTGGADRFTLYVNPTPGGPEPAAGLVRTGTDVGGITGITLYSTGAYSLDEIRVGQTFADVTPTPEPTTAMLLALGAAALGRRRSRSA